MTTDTKKYPLGQHPNSHKHSCPTLSGTWGTHPNSWKRAVANGFVPGKRKPPLNLA